jgi:23S rRNA (guanine1835-N2)-methyltransferase
VLFVDESYQAVACARENAEAAGLVGHEFLAADGLRELEHESLDLVLCNPPFHQAQAVDDIVAWRMFEQARRTLAPGGDLIVVGNRHLGYHIKLQRLFGQADVLGSDRKFVVLQGRK